MTTLEEEWAIAFPNRAFPTAGEITPEVVEWAAQVILLKDIVIHYDKP